MATNTSSRRQKWILGLFFAVIFGPVVFAYVLVQKNDRVALKLQHHGDLIKPLPKLQSFSEIDYTPYQGKWLMLIIAPQQCDIPQAERLQSLQQLQKALGKETHRVQQVWVTLSDTAQHSCAPLLASYPDLPALSLSESQFETQLGAFSHALKRQAQGELFLVDPQGHIMMHYDASVPTGDVLKDVKRLLRVSKIG